MKTKKKKVVSAWMVIVDGAPNVLFGMFDSEEDAKKCTWRRPFDPIVPCKITYTV